MEHEKQVMNVKRALDLEKKISETKQQIAQVQEEKFKPAPEAPVCQQATKQTPKIKPMIKFNWVLAVILLPFTCGIGTCIYLLFYWSRRKEEKERIRNSSEYRQQCAQAEQEFQRKQQELNHEYQEAMNEYKTVILPEYERELKAWKDRQAAILVKYQASLLQAESDLALHYESTKVVPLKYRTIPALQYIYDMVSTSDFNIRESIESYDKEKQQELERARLEEQQRANQLAEEQNQLADEQNYLLDYQNEIARKAKRDANIAAAVSAVQRHNTNKALNRRR